MKNNEKLPKALSKGVIRSDLCFKKGTIGVGGNQRSKEFQELVTNHFRNWPIRWLLMEMQTLSQVSKAEERTEAKQVEIGRVGNTFKNS